LNPGPTCEHGARTIMDLPILTSQRGKKQAEGVRVTVDVGSVHCQTTEPTSLVTPGPVSEDRGETRFR
jgi:hypothetical protein